MDRVVLDLVVVIGDVKLFVGFVKVLRSGPDNKGSSLVGWFDNGVR